MSKISESDKSRLVLSFDQFIMLHKIVMAYPNRLAVSVKDETANSLRSCGFLRLKNDLFWEPTEDGVDHIMPRKPKHGPVSRLLRKFGAN